MAEHQSVKYSCDNCGKQLKTFSNQLNIVTSKNESTCWRRLHVRIQEVSGVHNDAKTRNADLCKKCAILLLEDAVKRIKNGERATAGVEEIDKQGWK